MSLAINPASFETASALFSHRPFLYSDPRAEKVVDCVNFFPFRVHLASRVVSLERGSRYPSTPTLSVFSGETTPFGCKARK